MKNLKKRSRIIRIICIIFVLLISLSLLVAFYNVFKPLPEGISYEGKMHTLDAENIEFLYDLTYRNESGARIVEQQIFPRIFNLIDNAEQLIVIDAFLFNDDYAGKERLVPITDTLKDKLIAKKKQNPNITIIFITDEINNFYGSYASDELEALRVANITVVITDTTRLRDSNPLYSGVWRTYLQWFGTEGSGFLSHPLGNPNHNVTIRAFLKLFNTKANHRKVFIADNNGSIHTLLTSANPHEASSLHSNIALLVKRKIWQDALASEAAVARFSGMSFPDLASINVAEIESNATQEQFTAQLLTEGKIKQAIISDINSMNAGESIDLAMFYLSDREVVKALKRASKRGVELRVILDPNKDAFSREKNGIPNRQVGFELAKKGIKVRWYETQGEQFHTKLLVLHKKDSTIIYGGSANYTRRNLNDLNLESVIRVSVPPSSVLAAQVDSYFTRIWENKNGSYTLDFSAYEDSSKLKIALYRFQEYSGFSSF